MTRRRPTVKAQDPDARTTFSREAHKGRVWVSGYDSPHPGQAVLDPVPADNLVELINQTAHEARRYQP